MLFFVQELRLQLTLRQRWNDPRLMYHGEEDDANGGAGDFLSLVGDQVDDIWTPDTFIRQSKDTKVLDFDRTNKYARISPDGTVLVSVRYVRVQTINLISSFQLSYTVRTVHNDTRTFFPQG